MTLGERLRQFRKLAGLSQNELAKRAEINRPTVSELESNRQRTMTVDTARALAKALGISIDMLVGDKEDERQAAGVV